MIATFIFSNKSSGTGGKWFFKRLRKIIALLKERFEEVFVHETTTEEELADVVRFESERVDVISFIGGDGAFKSIVNALMRCEKKPTILYLPGGTANDMARNFKIPFNYKKAIEVFDQQKVAKFDIMYNGEEYISYVAGNGKLVNITYATKPTSKLFFGRLAYLFKGIGTVIKPHKPIDVALEIDGRVYQHRTPFILVMNGRTLGSMLLNRTTDMTDGQVEVFVTKPAPFSGIFHYAFGKIRTYKYRSSHVKIKTNSKEYWSFDGEVGPIGDLEIQVIPKALSIYCVKLPRPKK